MSKQTDFVMKLLDKALLKVDGFVPVQERNPTIGGGSTRTTAVGIIVAAKALVSAFSEMETEFEAVRER